MPAFLGQPSPFLSSFPTSVVFRTGLWEFFNRGPALPSSVSVCHGRPFFSKDTCALTPMPPSSVTSQVGFSAMPRSFPNFRNIDKTMATSLVDSINLRNNFLATKFSSHICKYASTCKVVSHYMTRFFQGTLKHLEPHLSS